MQLMSDLIDAYREAPDPVLEFALKLALETTGPLLHRGRVYRAGPEPPGLDAGAVRRAELVAIP